MVTLFIVSPESNIGKTAISAGISQMLQGIGKKIGFFKPHFGERTKGSDTDATFLKQTLNLPKSLDYICPVLDNDRVQINKVKEAYDRVSRGKDLVIVEGIIGRHPDDNLSKTFYSIASALKASVIGVEGYSSQLPELNDRYKGFGEGLLGIILNKFPQSQLKRGNSEMISRFTQAGINVLGVLPEDRALTSINVSELAAYLQGKILNSIEKTAGLVENFMLGAMVIDSGLEYFSRMENKAAIVRSDRPDMQMAALETLTRCLVLSGDGTSPTYSVLQKAENKGIPIIVTENNTNSIVTSIEDALKNTRFTQAEKLPIISNIMRHGFNFQAVNERLGLAN